jgi:hypothetical protein
VSKWRSCSWVWVKPKKKYYINKVETWDGRGG